MRRIALTCTLVIAASANTTHCAAWDPFGIQDTHEYMPFGPYGPKLTIGTPSPTKIRNGGKFGQKKHPVPQNRVAHRTAPSRTTRFDDLNLSVTTPSGPWVKLDPKKTGSRACLLLSRSNPTIIISLAGEQIDTEPGEQIGTEAADANSSLLTESQAKMMSLPGAAIAPGERQLSAGGIQGVAYEVTVGEGQSTTYYSIWVAAHHGYNYKLAVYGAQIHKPAIDAAMRNFVLGIKPIHSTRVAHGNGNKKAVTR